MGPVWKDMLGRQFSASIDMLENAMRACPAGLWAGPQAGQPFWYVAYHTLFFLDYYASGSETGFTPPPPFTLSELDPSGVLPDRVYRQDELLAYLRHGRAKAVASVDALTEENSGLPSGFPRLGLGAAELVLDNLRHVQHHAAQLNLLLHQGGVAAPGWVPKAWPVSPPG